MFPKENKHDTFGTATLKMKNCVWIAQAAVDRRSGIPKNHHKSTKKRHANQNCPRTCFSKIQRNSINIDTDLFVCHVVMILTSILKH